MDGLGLIWKRRGSFGKAESVKNAYEGVLENVGVWWKVLSLLGGAAISN